MKNIKKIDVSKDQGLNDKIEENLSAMIEMAANPS